MLLKLSYILPQGKPGRERHGNDDFEKLVWQLRKFNTILPTQEQIALYKRYVNEFKKKEPHSQYRWWRMFINTFQQYNIDFSIHFIVRKNSSILTAEKIHTIVKYGNKPAFLPCVHNIMINDLEILITQVPELTLVSWSVTPGI